MFINGGKLLFLFRSVNQYTTMSYFWTKKKNKLSTIKSMFLTDIWFNWLKTFSNVWLIACVKKGVITHMILQSVAFYYIYYWSTIVFIQQIVTMFVCSISCSYKTKPIVSLKLKLKIFLSLIAILLNYLILMVGVWYYLSNRVLFLCN